MTTLPKVNINGDSVETLIEQHWHVLKAVQELRNRLGQAAPHGRNYQLNSEGDIGVARAEWLVLMTYTKQIEGWAEMIVTDLLTQNVQRNGHEKANQIVMGIMR